MTVKEIYEVCVPPKKMASDKLNPWLYLVIRPLSIIFTKPLLSTKITPCQVTGLSMITTIVGFVLVAFGSSLPLKVIGWVGFFLWAILDCIDGNIARCKSLTGPRGELWDATGGYLALSLIFFSAGICAYYDNNIIEYAGHEIYLILGSATSLLSIFPRLIAQKKKAISSADAVSSVMDKNSFNLAKVIAMNIESAIGFMQILFLLCIIFNLLNVFVGFYFIFNVIITFYSLYTLLK